MNPEEELCQLACQDMPVSGVEVTEGMRRHKGHVLDVEYRLLRDFIEREARCPVCNGNHWKEVFDKVWRMSQELR